LFTKQHLTAVVLADLRNVFCEVGTLKIAQFCYNAALQT